MIPAPAPPADLLIPFLQQARWFGGKGRLFQLERVRELGEVPPARAHDPRMVIQLVTVVYQDTAPDQPDHTEHYQLPLAYYPQPQERLAHALVGVVTAEDGSTFHVYDALHDRGAMALWQRSFARPPIGTLAFHRLPGHELDLGAHSALLTGEQSNSSVVFGDDALLKVFRRLTPGPNPDITIHHRLTQARCDHIAALYGWLEVPAPPDVDGPADSGEVLHLAMLQQFLRTASDGWDLAQASVRDLLAEGDLHADEVGGDFAGEAARLGQTLAETHQVLAEQFGVEDLPASAADAMADDMHRRLAHARGVVPELEPFVHDLAAAYDALRDLTGLRVHRIHGDLHLGQALRTSRGWKIVDFEGEPAKPLAERSRPDSPWRDVAGMLRSLDYAARVVERTWSRDPDEGSEQRAYRAAEWSERNRVAFLGAYAGRELTAEEDVLLAAYVADKAVYETVYETRNRPTWVGIPLQALARIGVA